MKFRSTLVPILGTTNASPEAEQRMAQRVAQQRALALSIVVPVLNEADGLEAFVRHVRSRAPEAELVLVDGGSQDGTWERSHAMADRYDITVIRAPRGRASQMNAGAARSRGEVLWFLHADSWLPEDCVEAIHAAIGRRLVGGCFRLRLRGTPWVYRVSDLLGNIAVDLFRIALGDHGIFCRRDVFNQLGGYPTVALMEDARFYEAMVRAGPVRQLRPKIVTSSRRYEQLGPWRTTLHYLAILILYFVHAPASWQQNIFRRLVAPRRKAACPQLSAALVGGQRRA